MRRHAKACIAALLVMILGAATMSPVLWAGFTNWDDAAYVIDNPIVRSLSPSGLAKIATTTRVGNYAPITILSYALDCSFYGIDPSGFHLTNLILHLVSSLLVFLLAKTLLRSTLAAFFTALLFAIHPMHVETVAWISARKHLLATFFSLGCLHAYLKYLRRSDRRWLDASICLFALALLSNAMASAVVVLLVAIDVLQGRESSKRVFFEKVPFFLLALAAGAVAILVSRSSGALGIAPDRPLSDRLAIAAYNLVIYAIDVLYPHDLSSFHPHLQGPLPTTMWLALIGVTSALACVAFLWRGTPLLWFSTIFFVANLFLVLQWIPVGLATIAERYTYLAYLGPFLLLGRGLDRCWEQGRRRMWIRAVVLSVAVPWAVWLGCTSFERCQVWHDSETLWTNVISQYPEHYWAYNFRGQARFSRSHVDEAISDFSRSLERNPGYLNAWYNRGNAHAKRGDLAAAESDFDHALQIDPGALLALQSRAYVRELRGNSEGALLDRRRIQRLSKEIPTGRPK